LCKYSSLPFILFCVLFFSASGQGLKYESPRIEGFHPLDEEPFAPSALTSENPVILKLEFKENVFKDTAIIDFEKRQITFRRYDDLGFRLWEYHYKELSDYLLARRNYALLKGWKGGISVSRNDAAVSKQSVMKFQWEMPVHYPSWAQRLIGTDPPKLSINGSLTIRMGFDNSTYVESSVDTDHESNTGFDFQVDYQFSISGSIGRLISINISADNQNEFAVSDVFKNFKIHYKESTPGELEDEIIQEVVAGWTGFQMPGTELSGYSESNEGLFGIKVRSQLGPLSLTSVISHERGEAVKSTFSPNQGSEERVLTEEDYIPNKYFFLDNRYRRLYNRKYAVNGAKPAVIPEVDTLIVWRSVKSGDMLIDTATLENDAQRQGFVRLYRDRHYYLNETEGWIRFADTPDISNCFIAIFLRTRDPSFNKGRIISTEKDTIWNLWVLKPKDPIDSAGADLDTSRFYLMWRNVYELDAINLTDSKFRIVQKTIDDDNEREENENSVKFSDVLGISVDGQMSVDKPHIFDKTNGYLIFPPFDTSFFGNEPFRNPALGKYQDSSIYKCSKEVLHRENYNPYYRIYTTSSAKQTQFALGWGVMEGEVVKADGVILQRNVDYILDYSSGDLELVSPQARNAEKITVEYQREAMFVPEKKVFFGTRGELKLPFISDGSFAGLSFLYQNVKVNDKIPQLEQEPYNKGLLDFNIRIDLNPEWMTSLINKIPLINTTAESKMVLDIEYARSFMNPNPEGEAYVEDFEDSKLYSTLPTDAKGWYQASPPFFDSLTPDSLHRYPPAWDFYWFTPREEDHQYRVKIRDIKDLATTVATTNADDYESVLRLHCVPSPAPSYNHRYYNTWAGIMVPVNLKDKTEEQYFEFIVSASGGFQGKGKLLIQMGTMREDISVNGGPPNKVEDTEDPTLINNPDKVDSKRDNGLDTIGVDSLEYYLIPGLKQQWDTLHYGNPLLGADREDPGRDNFKKYYDKDGDINNRRYSNRRQGDSKLTSEDINYDYIVYTHKNESYFQYTIDLSDGNAPIIDKNANVKYENGWRKYRIPLKEVIKDYNIRDSLGNPSWKNIEMVRLIWTGFDSSALNVEHQLVFSDMQFVGSQWLPMYDTIGTKIEASAINNREDNFYRREVTNEPLVLVERDDNDEEEQESSLRLNFKNIKPGETALVTKSHNYHQINISAYEQLSLALYGRNPDGSTAKGVPLYDQKVHFVFRFGSDDSTYYEYRSDIYSGWQEVKIDLRKIAALKDSFMVMYSDTIPIEAGPIEISTQYGKAFLRVVSKAAQRQPNFSRIQWLGIGIVRDEDDINPKNSSGEIWVNEMKVRGINRLSGRAIRANFNTQWADFINMTGNLTFTDGDFRKMTDNTIQRQNSGLSTSFSSSMNLNKFLPQDWGFSLPVGGNYNSSVIRPQVKSNSDVVLTDENGRPDNVWELLTDKESLSRHYQQKNTSISSYINFDKEKKNDNPLLNLTLDRISGGFRYNTNSSVNRQGPSNIWDEDFKITNKSKTYSGNLKYNLTPDDPPSWTSWRPFESKGPSKLSDYQFSLLPENFQIDLIDVNQSSSYNTDTKRKTSSARHTFDVKHGLNFLYSPIAPLLELNYSLNISRDLQKYASSSGHEMVDNVFSLYKGNSAFARQYLILEGEKYRTQNAKINISPDIFDWLNTSADYSSDYQGNIVSYISDTSDYISASVNNTFSFDASFSLDAALKNLVDITSKSRLSKFFSGVDSFFNAISLNSVSFNYSASQGLINNYMNKDIIGTGLDFLKYQLGLKGKDFRSFLRGDMDDNVLGGMRYRALAGDSIDLYRQDRRSTDQRYSISSGLSISVPFQLSISPISISWSRKFQVTPDTNFFDTTITFPDFSLGLRTSSLIKLPFIKDFLNSLEFNSNMNLKRICGHKNGIDPDTTKEFSMSPLVGIQGVIKKWPINFSYRSRISRSKSYDKKLVSSQVSSGGHELDISYKIERNSRLSEINLLRWKIPVRGKTTMGLTGYRDVKTEFTNNRQSKQNEVSYSIKPYISYIFTDNITGSFEYTHGNQKKDEQETKNRKLALIVNIQFN